MVDSEGRVEMINRFATLEDAELKHLMMEVHRAPMTFDGDARIAIVDAARSRGFDIAAVLEESRQDEQSYAARAALEGAAKEQKRDRFYLHYGRVMGGLGLVVAVGVGILSVMAGHVGGIVTALVTAACSLWAILRKG